MFLHNVKDNMALFFSCIWNNIFFQNCEVQKAKNDVKKMDILINIMLKQHFFSFVI
jgi:hypothetical protein